MQTKELKKLLRALRKQKRETQPKTDARRQINRQIREVKKQLDIIDTMLEPDTEKKQLIDELTELYQRKHRPILVDFRLYTKEQLLSHITRVKSNLC